MDYSGRAMAEGVKVVAGVSNGTYVNSTQVTKQAYTENWRYHLHWGCKNEI